MEQCVDCGEPCGKRHPTGLGAKTYLCDSCARKRANGKVQCVVGLIFLLFGAALSAVVTMTVLHPLAADSGYGAARGLAIGIGIGGVVLYFVLRSVAGRIDGCLLRMIVKFIGSISLATGIVMLFLTFLLEDQFKDMLGVKANAAPVEEVSK